jgi:integrative and conjugative element protein (TIGR02256 family)
MPKMKSEPWVFTSPAVEWELWLAPEVLRHFAKQRQTGRHAPEVGGQLFASFEKFRVRVTLATGPRKPDLRGRFSFQPDRSLENAEIKKRFAGGLHFIGDWHTHPEPQPTPSALDLRSMADCFRRSKHSLAHFVMIIVGQDDGPAGLWVSLHDAKRHAKMNLKPSAEMQNEANVSAGTAPDGRIARLSKRSLDAVKKMLRPRRKK